MQTEGKEERPLVSRQEDWMVDEALSLKKTDTIPVKTKSYKDACLKDYGSMDEEEEEEDRWWCNDGWKSCITVDNTGSIPNIVLSEELSSKMA